MAAADLLQQLEPHTHGERAKAMIALGHQADAESRDSAHVLRSLLPHGYALPAVVDRLVTKRNFTTRGCLPVLRVALAVLAEEPLECHERVAP